MRFVMFAVARSSDEARSVASLWETLRARARFQVSSRAVGALQAKRASQSITPAGSEWKGNNQRHQLQARRERFHLPLARRLRLRSRFETLQRNQETSKSDE